MTVYKDDDGDYRCGYCDHWIDIDWDYCPDCGEKIDWNDVEAIEEENND